MTERDEFPDDIQTLKERLHGAHAEIERLRLIIAKLQRLHFGPRSEKIDQEIEQLELQLEELQLTHQAARAAIVATQEKAPLCAMPLEPGRVGRRRSGVRGCRGVWG